MLRIAGFLVQLSYHVQVLHGDEILQRINELNLY